MMPIGISIATVLVMIVTSDVPTPGFQETPNDDQEPARSSQKKVGSVEGRLFFGTEPASGRVVALQGPDTQPDEQDGEPILVARETTTDQRGRFTSNGVWLTDSVASDYIQLLKS